MENNPLKYVDPSGNDKVNLQEFYGDVSPVNTHVPSGPRDKNDVNKLIPYFGRKLEYLFGNATGDPHNILRSIEMEKQLNAIGIYDDPIGRKMVIKNLTQSFYDFSSIAKVQDNGRILRDSLLVGLNGVVKIESVWDKEKLITIFVYGGKIEIKTIKELK